MDYDIYEFRKKQHTSFKDEEHPDNHGKWYSLKHRCFLPNTAPKGWNYKETIRANSQEEAVKAFRDKRFKQILHPSSNKQLSSAPRTKNIKPTNLHF